MLRHRAVAAFALLACGLLATVPARAQTTDTTSPPPAMTSAAPADQKLQGLWLTTSFPAVMVHQGDAIALDLTLQNRGMPPRRVEFSVDNLPTGWAWEIDGGGKIVGAAMVAPDTTQSLTLKLTPPKDAKTGEYSLDVTGKTDAEPLKLPISLYLAAPKPETVTVEPKLPALRGTSTSAFDFDVDVKNDSAEDQTFNLVSDGPPGFQITFTEAYGQQQLTSIPIKAGENKSLKVSVKLPQDVAAGQYQVAVQAASPKAHGETPLLLDVTGAPTLDVSAPEGRLSGSATAGKETTFPLIVHNSGTAAANGVKLNASAPQGWKAEFDPKEIDALPAGEDANVSLNLTPAENAIAGDYMISTSASGDGAYATASLRITVLTSTLWGIAGLGIIGAAVIVLAAGVTRYGRR